MVRRSARLKKARAAQKTAQNEPEPVLKAPEPVGRDLSCLLPVELLTNIFESLLIERDGHTDNMARYKARADLKNASLVCSAWSSVARYVLWSRSAVRLDGTKAKALSASSNQPLNYVKSATLLHLFCRANDPFQHSNASYYGGSYQIDKNLFSEVVAQLRMVKELEFTRECACVSFASELDVVLPSVTKLRLTFYPSEVSTETIKTMLRLCPRVREVIMPSKGVPARVRQRPDTQPLDLPHLDTLDLSGFGNSASLDLVPSIFSLGTLKGVKKITLERPGLVTMDQDVVDSLAESLEHLVLRSVPPNAPHVMLDTFEPFSQLRRLELDPNGHPSLLPAINNAFADCPASIEYLILSAWADEVFDIGIPVPDEHFEGKKLTRLDLHYVVHHSTRFDHDQYGELCRPLGEHLASKGIELNLFRRSH